MDFMISHHALNRDKADISYNFRIAHQRIAAGAQQSHSTKEITTMPFSSKHGGNIRSLTMPSRQ
jgi:hypothetical protein